MTEEEELELLRLRKRRALQAGSPQADMLTHFATPPTEEQYLREQASKEFGVPPAMVDLSEPAVGPGYRALEGVATDTPGEATNLYRRVGPAGRYEQVGDYTMYQAPGSPVVQPTNAPGADWGDAAQFAGGAAGPVAAGVAVSAAGVKRPWLIGSIVQGGYELAKEGVQALTGIQDEDPESYGLRTALGPVGEVAPPMIARQFGKLKSVLGKGRATIDMNEEELADALSAVDLLNLPKLQAYQQSGDPIIKRLADQVLQVSPKNRPKVIEQLNQTKAALDNYRKTMIATSRDGLPRGAAGPPRPVSRDYLLQQQKAKEFARRRSMLQPPQDPKAAGTALETAVKKPPVKEAPGAPPGGLDVRKAQMNQEYDKLFQIVDDGVETPTFSVANSRAAAGPRKVMGEGRPRTVEGKILSEEGKPLTVESVAERVNVAGDSPAQVKAIRGMMSELSDEQTDFRVIKELRSQLGKFYRQSDAYLAEAGIDKAEVNKLYGALSDDMIPTNAADTPLFNAQREVAEEATRFYHRPFGYDQVATILGSRKKDNPEQLWDMLAGEPTTWVEHFTKLVEEGDPAKVATVRQNLANFIAGQDDAPATIMRWRDKAPDALKFVYGSEEGIQNAFLSGQEMKQLNSSIGRQAFDSVTEKRGFALMALRDRLKNPNPNETPVQAASRLRHEVGGYNTPEGRALRNAALETVYRDALQMNTKFDTPGLEPTALRKGIDELKENGWWDGVLSKKDQDVMEALLAYAKKTWETGDTGTALTIASQVGKLRGGSGLSGMGEAAMSLRASSVLASLVTAENTPKDVLFDKIPFDAGRKAARYAKSRPPMGTGKGVRTLKMLNRMLRQEASLDEDQQPQGQPTTPPPQW